MEPINEELQAAVLEELEGLTDEEIEAEAKKVLAQKAKQRARMKSANTSPESMEKKKLRRQRKYLREKALIARAKELGVI